MTIIHPHKQKSTHQINLGASFLHLNDVPNFGILLCDRNGYIVDVNKKLCKLLSLSQRDIIGNHLKSDACLKMGLQQVDTCFHDFLRTPVKTCKSHLEFKKDESLFFEIKAKLVSSEHIGFFFKDISEESNLKPSLEEEIKELEVLNEDKNRFLSILAHDLKNSIGTILGFVQLLKENYKGQSFENIEKYISYVENNAKKTYNLLEDTLVWTGAESGKFVVNNHKCILKDLLLEVLAEFSAVVKLKDIAIRFDPTSEITAFCDARILKIILRNLVSNAIKFTNKGGQIEVQFTKNVKEVLVSVSDTGIGMTPKLANSLFNTTTIKSTDGTGNEKGSGIGLTICKELIEKQEGDIWVTSKVGSGSNFMFTLPIEDV